MQSLKECLIESYTGIVFGVKEAKDTSILDLFVNDIFEYLSILCNDDSLSLPMAKSIAGLIGDIAQLYGKKVENLLKSGFMIRLKQILASSHQKDCADTYQYLLKAIALTTK